ncbi:hypothetical protein PINS_up000304 [Pythium insidiosum]|nr:hypothetical protein PINS_up000304 [Pythium insidiosum]
MFRSKKKKVDGNGAARKRRDIGDDDDAVESIGVPAGNGVTASDASLPTSIADDDAVMPDQRTADDADAPVGVNGQNGGDDDDDDDAMMERIRRRAQRANKSKASAVSFGSTVRKAAKRAVVDDFDSHENNPSGSGALSFAGQELSSDRPKRKMKIRPNLSVSHATTVERDELDESTGGQYSADMLAALMREQNVKMRPPAPVIEETTESAVGMGDVAMEGEIHEETKMDGEDEFIPLDAKYMQARRNKRRVTFGVPVDPSLPSKTMEVEEPVLDNMTGEGEGDSDGPEDDQQKRWEEELMRRGGHHVREDHRQRFRADGENAAYPTRKKVPHASLFEVLHSLQRKLDHGTAECDRISREDARLEAEASLLETKLKQQQEELTVSSEQFEYFQEIEDFVKSLSFCLRAKLPLIQEKEQEFADMYETTASRLIEQRDQDVTAELRLCLAGGTISEQCFVGLQPENLESGATPVEDEKAHQAARFARFLRPSFYSEKYEKPDVAMAEDLFEDAVEEISSLANVYGRFQEWRAKFPDVYKTTYCNLALVKLMSWFNTLRRHRVSKNDALEEPVCSLIRDIIMDRLATAVSRRFNPRSSAHTNSVILLLEDLRDCHAIQHVEHALESVVPEILSKFTTAAKKQPLVALNQADAKLERAAAFGRFLIGEFNALVENAAALFVALPHGPWHERGFHCVMQVLHHLLAYLKHCEQLDRTALVPQAVQTVQQLSSSTFMQSVLARSASERMQFQNLLNHFAPYLRPSTT